MTIFFFVQALGLVSVGQAQSVEDFLTQSGSMAARRELQQAVRLLEQGLQLHSNDPRLSMQLASILVKLDRLDAAAAMLGQFPQQQRDQPEWIRLLAEIRIKQGRVGEARDLLADSRANRPGDAATHFGLAFADFAQSRDEKALVEARRAVALAPMNVPYRHFYALLLRLADRRDESIQQLRLVSRIDPDDIPALLALSHHQAEQGEIDLAIRLARRVVSLDADTPLHHLHLSRLYGRAHRFQDAARSQQRSRTLSGAFDRYLDALRKVQADRIPEAVAILESCLRIVPDFSHGLLLLASLYAGQGRAEDALNLYDRLLLVDPTGRAARQGKVDTLLARGSVDLALLELGESPEDRENADLWVGYRHMQQGQWSQALQRFERVRRSNPLLPGLLELVSECLKQLNRFDEAVGVLLAIQRVDPDRQGLGEAESAVRFEQAQQAQRAGDWEAAIQHYTSLIESAPGTPDYEWNLAYCYQQLGRLDEAIELYRSGLEKSPAVSWARVNLASLLYLQQKYEQACVQWQIIVRAEDSAQAQEQLGLCLTHLGRNAEAERAFERAQRGGKVSVRLLFNLGVVRLRLMKLDSAWNLIRAAARRGYPPAQRMVARADRR